MGEVNEAFVGEVAAAPVGAQSERAVVPLVSTGASDGCGTPTQGPAPWVPPDACTLPTVEQPLRTAQFDDLFATGVTAVERVARTRLRLELAPQPAVAARAAELAVRETDCCGFFTFTLTTTGSRVQLEVAVPVTRVDVLDALAERAVAGVRFSS